MALPNPFQNSTLSSPVLSSTPKVTNNEKSFLPGYRSNFDINQQKAEYHQRMSQQASQKPQFNRNQPQKNIQTEKSNTPSNNWCHLCDCNFKYPQQLQRHKDEHEKCWFDDCNFEGSSMLLKQHIETQHQSGLFQRISKIETDEDIEKWREERRKRYPTKANIELRRLAQEERMKRGERIQEPNHRFGNVQHRKQRSFTENDSMNNHRTKKNDKKRHRTRNKNKSDEKIANDKNGQQTTTVPAKKTETVKSEMVGNNNASATEQRPVEPKEKTVPTTNALSAIMGIYGSDSDCDDDDDNNKDNDNVEATTSVNNVPANKQEEQVNNITEHVTAASDPISEAVESDKYNDADESTKNMRRKRDAVFTEDKLPIKQFKSIDSSVPSESIDQKPNDNESDDDDGAPEEQPIQRCSNDGQDIVAGPSRIRPQETKKTDAKSTPAIMMKKKTIVDMTRKIRNQNTLLEKLLQKEIRHERNVLLQCVRYVVENNFFGIGQKTDEQNEQNKQN
ncbi:nuclear fragile X mental retardation-interacting protein 1, partial [Contarinia nasturtii]|uniref:nuclear fragile X mental retardation-interacting protein 1 n=1 Tax=Contarinia nasturtii TaxID=265458 RepID=UPI0012D41601